MGVTFPVCEFLRDELDARGWSIETFCERTGLQRYVVEELLGGKRRLTKLTALCLEAGFGISADMWLQLQDEHEKGGGDAVSAKTP